MRFAIDRDANADARKTRRARHGREAIETTRADDRHRVHVRGFQCVRRDATRRRRRLTARANRTVDGHATGAWLEEIATPYYALLDAGFAVDVVSVKGGKVPIDSASESGDFFTADCQKFYDDEDAKKALANAKALKGVKSGHYAGIYLAGGHGTCVDFLNNATLTRVIEETLAADKPVAADCHGPVALLACKKPNGDSILKGTNATCFTDAEETAVGLAEKVPVLLETEFKKLGAQFNGAADWTPNAVTDGKLVTGQNPASSKACVDAFLALLKK
jgi:putative intracellular protease/amidase|tara:strand:- start:1758 stop:2585 length:828 start_codon:yes stop_codon:yes gene_type:complete